MVSLCLHVVHITVNLRVVDFQLMTDSSGLHATLRMLFLFDRNLADEKPQETENATLR